MLLQTADGRVYSYADAQRESGASPITSPPLGARTVTGTVQVEKCPEVLWLYLACLRAGLVCHPLNTAYQSAELEYFLNDAKPTVVVCGGRPQRC